MTPSPAQKAWIDLRFGLFIHFGINTFYDTEWSDGTLSPSAFNPTEFDPDQWCETARAAGMRFVLLTAKHHDGFCNWPTAYTGYSVASSPTRIDVMRDLSRAAEAAGLRLGFYYSLWDRHEPTDDDDAAYGTFMKRQLTELLSDYGPICEIWFDGFWAKMPGGIPALEQLTPDGLLDIWRDVGAKRWGWDDIYRLVKQLQPDCIVINNSMREFSVPLYPADARSSEQRIREGSDNSDVFVHRGLRMFVPAQVEITMSNQGGVHGEGSWFWHPGDHYVRPAGEILDLVQATARRSQVLVLNVGPMATGKIRPEDETVLREVGSALKREIAR